MINKSKTPSKYYIVTQQRYISIWRKLLRILVRYLLPVVLISGIFIVINAWLFNGQEYGSYEKYRYISSVILASIGATILSHYWFKLITIIEDKEKDE